MVKKAGILLVFDAILQVLKRNLQEIAPIMNKKTTFMICFVNIWVYALLFYNCCARINIHFF